MIVARSNAEACGLAPNRDLERAPSDRATRPPGRAPCRGRYIQGPRQTRPGAPVAVLDTGIAKHPDLNVEGGHNCSDSNRGDSGDYDDRDGHGTHVAGTIGASRGMAGVAPGTPLWAVKVLGDSGFGSLSAVIRGLEWVIDTRDDTGVVAINLSLGAPVDDHESKCDSSSFHQAICNAKRAGLAIVAAAGNENEDARGFVPAAYSQVITVAAMTDTDGCAGGHGDYSSWGSVDTDDRKWIHSNFGSVVDVIAPGVDIRTTAHDGGYRELSGASMAAPHVAGAIARNWKPGCGRSGNPAPASPPSSESATERGAARTRRGNQPRQPRSVRHDAARHRVVRDSVLARFALKGGVRPPLGVVQSPLAIVCSGCALVTGSARQPRGGPPYAPT